MKVMPTPEQHTPEKSLFKDIQQFDNFFEAILGRLSLGFYSYENNTLPSNAIVCNRDFVGLCFNFGADFDPGLPSGPLHRDEFNIIHVPKEQFLPVEGLMIFTLECELSYLEKLAEMYPRLNLFLKRAENHSSAQMSKAHQPITDAILNIVSSVHECTRTFYENQEALTELLCDRLPRVLILALEKLSERNANEQNLPYDFKKIREAHAHLLSHITDPITITELAFLTGISKDRLENGFKEIYGSTIHSFVIENRLKMARAMLRDTSMSVQRIVKTVGYKSPSSFIRDFKKKYGYTPGAFRNGAGGKDEK